MGYYWDMGGRVYNAGTWVAPKVSDYDSMMRYIYESFFKGADANVK